MVNDTQDELVRDFVSRLRKYGDGGVPRNFKPREINSKQTGTIAFPEQARVAALLYDKIWVPPKTYQRDFGFDFGDDQPPTKIQFCSHEDVLDLNAIGTYLLFANDVNQVTNKMIEKLDGMSKRYEKKSRFVRTMRCSKDFKMYEKNYPLPAVRAIIKNIQIPVNERLSWEQIIEFRKDKRSIESLKSMNVWVKDALRNKSEDDAL